MFIASAPGPDSEINKKLVCFTHKCFAKVTRTNLQNDKKNTRVIIKSNRF